MIHLKVVSNKYFSTTLILDDNNIQFYDIHLHACANKFQKGNGVPIMHPGPTQEAIKKFSWQLLQHHLTVPT